MARSRKPQVLQNEVLARTLARQSKSRIAREMAIDRQTVTRIQECHNLPQLLADSRQFIVEKVLPDAIISLHEQIKDRHAPGDGDLAARLLEKSGVLAGDAPATFNPRDDPRLQVLLAIISGDKNAGLPQPAPAPQLQPAPAIAEQSSARAMDRPCSSGNGTAPNAGAELTVDAVPVPARPPQRPAHQPDCGCEACRCPDCNMRRNPFDAAGRILLSDRCLCVPRGSALA